MKTIILAKETIAEVRGQMPNDQGAEAYPGCIYIRGKGWEITIYPKTNRAAYCEGGMSEWGDVSGLVWADDQIIDARIDFDDPGQPVIVSLLP